VKKIALALLFLFSTLAWSAADANPADYTISVHVSSSRIDIRYPSELRLSVVIEGKKYDLLGSVDSVNTLLALGDYKAKLVKDEHKTTYLSRRVYEFIFPDKKIRKFTVVGQTE
jgi:hypothetical protein